MCAPSAAPWRMRAEQTRRCAPHPQGRCAANANPMERKRDASREARMRSTQGKSHPMGITIAHGPGGRAALRALWRKHKAAARQTAAHTRRSCTRHSFEPLRTSLSFGLSGSWAVRLYRSFPKHGVLIADKPQAKLTISTSKKKIEPFLGLGRFFSEKKPELSRLWHINFQAL